ncbi:MAG: thioredoxin domain-containing protein [Elusimicrobiota bacterium]
MPRTPRQKPLPPPPPPGPYGFAPTPEKPATAGKLFDATTPEEVTKMLAEATGPVVLDFVEEGCGFCEEEKPEVEKLAKDCSGVTIIRVDPVKHPGLDGLTDQYLTGPDAGFPTLFVANKGSDMKPGEAVQVDDAAALRKRLKCPREPKA